MIETWKKRPFVGYRKVASCLHVFLRNGKAYASWVNSPLGRAKLIPVGDELAADVLGARREPCPHNGTQPVYSMFGKPGYTCRDRTVGEDCKTVEQCTVCGYWSSYDGNPRFRAAFGSGEYSIGGHPDSTYLAASQTSAIITAASWNADCEELTLPSKEDGTLIVWVPGKWHLRQDGADRARERMFPDAEHITSNRCYTMLRTACKDHAI